jgi:hypothetical protein
VLVEQVEEDPQKSKRLTTKELVMENIDYMLDIYMIYILTLSIFPTFLSEDTEAHNLESWYFLLSCILRFHKSLASTAQRLSKHWIVSEL